MVRAGSMIAYTGDLTFTGKSSADGGLTGFVKEAVTSEGTSVMAAEGTGYLYVADRSKKVQVLELDDGESIQMEFTGDEGFVVLQPHEEGGQMN